MSQHSLAWIRPGIMSVVTISLFSSTSVWSWRSKKLKTMTISVFWSGMCSIFTHFWNVLVVVVEWQTLMSWLKKFSTFFGKLSTRAHTNHSTSLSCHWESLPLWSWAKWKKHFVNCVAPWLILATILTAALWLFLILIYNSYSCSLFFISIKKIVKVIRVSFLKVSGDARMFTIKLAERMAELHNSGSFPESIKTTLSALSSGGFLHSSKNMFTYFFKTYQV